MTRLHTDIPREGRGVLWLAAAVGTLGVVVLSLIGYLIHRTELADQRAERQRAAICAILANIPGDVPKPIADARTVFAHHPGDCQPIRHHAVPPRLAPTPARTVLIVPVPAEQPPAPASSRPTPSRTATARPTQTPASSTPTPQPTPTCVHVNPIHKSICINETEAR